MIENNKIAEGLIKGDKKTFDYIYNKYNQRIFCFALSFLKSKEDAYDIIHDVFIKIWESRATIKKEKNFESFIFTITRNTVLSLFRKRASEKEYLNHIGFITTSNSIGTEEASNYDFLEEKINYYISQLPPKRQKIFLLSRKSGLSNKKIAQQLNISEKTVEDHLSKALASLKKNMLHYRIYAQLFIAMFW